MAYKHNPKTEGSGIVCAIPHKEKCPIECPDCFFQSGRSYLEPLEDNLPNMPEPDDYHQRIVRVNDGHDSNIDRELVMKAVSHIPDVFYNTSIPTDLESFDDPVVLTLNPGRMTDRDFHRLEDIPENLMFVRFRVNTWNNFLFREAVQFYGDHKVPVVATFIAYYQETIPEEHKQFYVFKKRTLNSYWVIKTDKWREIMDHWRDTSYEKWVSTCSRIEGERGERGCRFCGVCLREYYATWERINRGF